MANPLRSDLQAQYSELGEEEKIEQRTPAVVESRPPPEPLTKPSYTSNSLSGLEQFSPRTTVGKTLHGTPFHLATSKPLAYCVVLD